MKNQKEEIKERMLYELKCKLQDFEDTKLYVEEEASILLSLFCDFCEELLPEKMPRIKIEGSSSIIVESRIKDDLAAFSFNDCIDQLRSTIKELRGGK